MYRRKESSTIQQLGRTLFSPLHGLCIKPITKPVHFTIPAAVENDELGRQEISAEVPVPGILPGGKPPTDFGLALPHFDRLEAYRAWEYDRISQEACGYEARRLYHCVKVPDLPALFSSAYFRTRDDYQNNLLSALSEKVFTAVSFCMLDNESINICCCRKISSRNRFPKSIDQASVSADPTIHQYQ